MGKLGRRMNARQQVLATAQVYVRRFYLKREIRTTNPYLVLSTAFYLACKMEEAPQHIRVVVGEARQFWSGKFVHFCHTTSRLALPNYLSK
jgi:cyclin C